MHFYSASNLFNGAYVNNFEKSNSDQIKSGVPSSMRTCHKYNIIDMYNYVPIIYNAKQINNQHEGKCTSIQI